ncbi:MAG TPA: TIM barrel protein [Galbitalea sp.]|nr:TIM barrel protein [Galbitalea sp.]
MIGVERLSLSIPISVGELPPGERVERAAAAGYHVLESWWPWPELVPTASDRATFVDAFVRMGSRLHLLNLSQGPAEAGGRGIAGVPGNDAEFDEHAAAVVDLAAELGARWINALAGNATSVERPRARGVLSRRLRVLATAGVERGVGVLLEPLNHTDHSDYLLDPAEVPQLVRELRADRLDVALLADVYHVASDGKDPVEYVTVNADVIGHVQLADYPGRGRPGTGAIPFNRLLAALDEIGYPGFLGLEHRPDGPLRAPADVWRDLTVAA